MVTAFADFHVHIGRSLGRPVKMAAAPSLTLSALLDHARTKKGLNLITVIDGVCDGPLVELERLLAQGELQTLPGGGLQHENGLVVLVGSEIEVGGPQGGAAHFGCWFGDTHRARDFAEWLGTVQKNTSLSSQRARVDAYTLQTETLARGGLFIVHHAFTPHKGLYGNCVARMAEMLDPALVHAVELGLSADSDMADRVSELADFTFLTNSDAHSLPKVAREYNQLQLETADFDHVRRALQRLGDDAVVANYGMDPLLGKYHLTACAKCGASLPDPAAACACGATGRTVGVAWRLNAIADLPTPHHPPHRPRYVHQVPLEFIPGVGPRTLTRLFAACGTEMDVLHRRSVEELSEVVGDRLAEAIDLARRSEATITAGSGGVYGKLAVGPNGSGG